MTARRMRIVVMSDTHMLHRTLTVPDGDVLVHCGDWSVEQALGDYDDFFDWLGALPHARKILTAGNHESLMRDFGRLVRKRIPKNVIYLRDEGVVIDGVRFWASPYSTAPAFMAFTFKHIGDAEKHWEQVPRDTDVLITHGPPYGILDTSVSGQHIGDPALYKRVEKIRPILHLFGHVHGCGGRMMERFATQFVNAAIGDDPRLPDLSSRIQVAIIDDAERKRLATEAFLAGLEAIVGDLSGLTAGDEEFDYFIPVPVAELHVKSQRISDLEHDIEMKFRVCVSALPIPV